MPVMSLYFPSCATQMEISNRPCDIILVIIHSGVMLAVPLTLLESNEENLEEGLGLQGDSSNSTEFLSVCIFNNQFTCIPEN